MISKTLLRQTIRENLVLWFVLTGVQALLLAVMGGTTNVATSSIAYYNMLPEILSAIYVIITGNKLISAQVDKGTLAYVLSTPVKRTAVTLTQSLYFAGSLFVMFGISAGVHILSTQLFNEAGIQTGDISLILKLNLGLFVLALAYSGICFLASCIFNLSKYTIAVGGGLVGISILLPIISMFGENFKNLKNFSLSSLYSATSIVQGNNDFIWHFAILAGVGIVTMIVGSVIFDKRDLPL
jgi:ABC-2 type transport system permease protein